MQGAEQHPGQVPMTGFRMLPCLTPPSPSAIKPISLQSIIAYYLATGAMTVTLFVPCFVDLLFPQVAISMVNILERLGHKVQYLEDQICCGQPAFNSGYWNE